MDLKQEYREETNLEPYFDYGLDCITGFSTDYVKWLEAKINFTGSSLELKGKEALTFEEWLVHNKFEVATPFSYKRCGGEHDVKDLRKLYDMLHDPLIT